jgi:agmatine/peptidylarginine deiminase
VLLLLVCGLLFAGGSFVGGLLLGQHESALPQHGKPLSFYKGNSEERVVPEPAQTLKGAIPGEFEHQAAIMIGANEMLAYHPRTFIQMVAALYKKTKVMGLIWSEEQRTDAIALLKANKLPADAVDFYVWPSRSMWVRDYGPFFVMESKTGPAHIVDYAYIQPNRDYGALFSATFAGTFGYQFSRAELSFEGGNMLTNGDGLCVTTNVLFEQNLPRGYDEKQIGDILGHDFQFTRWAHLKPLDGEPTHHADMFCTICGTNQAVIGSYNPDEDPANAAVLDDNAATLAKNATSKGPMQVARIPMPDHRDGNWRTYTNVIYANGTILVPQYGGGDVDRDKAALAVYRKLLPTWDVVAIDCSTLADKRGALHCISFNIPWLPEAAQ